METEKFYTEIEKLVDSLKVGQQIALPEYVENFSHMALDISVNSIGSTYSWSIRNKGRFAFIGTSFPKDSKRRGYVKYYKSEKLAKNSLKKALRERAELVMLEPDKNIDSVE